jgi:hypothetical protein
MRQIRCANLLRKTVVCLAVLGLAVVGLTASASASPTVFLKAKAVPIPGYPHTGNILGAGAAIQAEYTISGIEYGGFPPPVTGITFYDMRTERDRSEGAGRLSEEIQRGSERLRGRHRELRHRTRQRAGGGAPVFCSRWWPGVLRKRCFARFDRNSLQRANRQFLAALRPEADHADTPDRIGPGSARCFCPVN